MEFGEIVNNISPLSERALSLLSQTVETVTYKKGDVVIRAGRCEDYMYFIKKGLVRAYFPADDKDVTFWIGQEGAVLISMESYVLGKPGYETIDCIEDVTLYRIAKKHIEHLYETDVEIANWGRKFAELEIIRAEKVLIPMLFTTASERYEEFMKRHPDLLNRMSLELIASYLGITPVSLSRIRGKRR